MRELKFPWSGQKKRTRGKYTILLNDWKLTFICSSISKHIMKLIKLNKKCKWNHKNIYISLSSSGKGTLKCLDWEKYQSSRVGEVKFPSNIKFELGKRTYAYRLIIDRHREIIKRDFQISFVMQRPPTVLPHRNHLSANQRE